MDRCKNFEHYCDIVIRSKKIEMPDKKLSPVERMIQFKENCQSMAQFLEAVFNREIENLKTQALAKGEPVPDEIQIKLVQISTTKIQAFLQSAEHAFKA